jgi:predicted metal-binding membrane protein
MVADGMSALERLIRQDRWWIACGLVATVALAWVYLLREAAAMNTLAAQARMQAAMGIAGMNRRDWGAADWLTLFLMWAVMMVAMMLPSAAPVILLDDDMSLRSALLSGIVLLAAGVYQWLPLKNTCLTHCRSALSFLTQHWREGPSGALRMGVHHGTYCVGCCWLLMVLLFIVGVMNLFWVAALSAFVLVEKVVPRGALIGRVAGLAAAVWGMDLIVR